MATSSARSPRAKRFTPPASDAAALFEGFADRDAKFFKALARHQDREWFAAHKAEFEAGWNAPMKGLVAEVREAIDGAYPHCDLEEARVFRIFRDVRFSKDKSPYKTHLGGHISVKRGAGDSDSPTALYVHVGHDEAFAAAGYYMMAPPALAKFRAAVADEARGKELAQAVSRLEKKGFTLGAHEMLTRVPKGFDPAHPRAELLKRKGLIVRMPPLSRDLLTSRKLVGWLVAHAKAVSPLVEWLVFATA
jgi:uncharacterized protein (TIGR02453 family)